MKTGSFVFQCSLVAILGGAVLGSTLAISQRSSDYQFFDPLVDIKAIISQRYVEEPDLEALQRGAIDGLIEALNDPYTVYVPVEDRREFDKQLTGDFVGIGVSIAIKDGWLTVLSPLEDTPAFKAGIQAGDRIAEIEGTSTLGLDADKCIDLLSGNPGTSVGIVVEREGKRFPLTITRERIIARTVKGVHWNGAGGESRGGWDYMIDPRRKIAYLRLTQFTPSSSQELAKALESLGAREGELGGLILDLRWNPGGVLNEATAIADLFLKEGVIVSTRGRTTKEEVYRADGEGTLPDFPLVMLVNGQSASASEVLSGALSDHGRAIVIGTRTFGKGLVQSVIGLPAGDGAQLKITEQRYYLPSGRCIQRTDDSSVWGVDPTDGFYVPMTDEELTASLRIRADEDIIRAASAEGTEGGWADPEWILEHMKDKQLAAAVRAVQGRIDTGAWAPTGEPLKAGEQLALDDLKKSQVLRERLLRELDRVDRRIESLEVAAAEDAGALEFDLWPDDIDLSGGRLVVYDKDGKPVSKLRINGADLERWLIDAGVEPEAE